jgi:hypothetical protein
MLAFIECIVEKIVATRQIGQTFDGFGDFSFVHGMDFLANRPGTVSPVYRTKIDNLGTTTSRETKKPL